MLATLNRFRKSPSGSSNRSTVLIHSCSLPAMVVSTRLVIQPLTLTRIWVLTSLGITAYTTFYV